MNDLKNHFLHRSIAGLQGLAVELKKENGQISPDAFRILHTIKGTAQTFGLAAAAKLAHELEDVLASRNNALLLEGIPLLISALEEKEGADSAEFSKKAGAAAGEKPEGRKTFISKVPPETFDQFSDTEKRRLFSIGPEGRDIFCLHVGFALADFTEDFKRIKEKLDEAAEIIATLPGSGDSGQISFRIYTAATDPVAIEEICSDYSGTLEGQSAATEGALYGALAQIGEHVETVATASGKDVNVIIFVGDLDPGIDTVKIIFDVLLHLARNAVDHAFMEKGTIRIGVSETADGLLINFSDDGRGLDPDKLRAKAVEKGLINEDFGGEPLDLIFLPGFSTAEKVSETSGRGVGLDAVKDVVETAGGTIKVTSEKGAGTAFAVFLPE